jgi:YD repeat-containing protein
MVNLKSNQSHIKITENFYNYEKLSEVYKKLGIAFTFPIKIKDEKGNQTYCERSNGFWYRYEYDKDGNKTYYEDSDGFWSKWEYDEKGKVTYCETSSGLQERNQA